MPGVKGHREAKKENGDYSNVLVVLTFSIGIEGNLGVEVRWIRFAGRIWEV